MKRCVIIGGAPINNYERIKQKLNKDDYFIFCDSGLNHLDKLSINPSLIVGDFDSHKNPNLDIETITLPTVKDDTDTMFAVKEGLKRGFDEFLLLGVIGLRIDHSLGNLSILLYLEKEGKKASIIDDYSEIEIVGKCEKYIEDTYKYFSIISSGDIISGVTIKNAKYALNKAQITNYFALGVSNEVIKGKCASVKIDEGFAYLIKVF